MRARTCADKMMFVWGAILSAITTAIFYFVDPDEDERIANGEIPAADDGQELHWSSLPTY